MKSLSFRAVRGMVWERIGKFSFWLIIFRNWFGILVPLLILGALSEDVWEGENFHLDSPTLLWLHAHSNPWFDAAMLWFTRIGGALLLAAAGLFSLYLLICKHRREAGFVALGMVGTGLLNLIAKLVFGRARPDLWLSLAPETDYSFPSGHAMLSSAFIGIILILLWRSLAPNIVKIAATFGGLLFVFSVGLSRLYLGVHFPTDVLAGWLASTAWLALLRMVNLPSRRNYSLSSQ